MNYHHIYHAGNFADISKHIILILCLEKLHEKPTSFLAIDTHSGIAKYDLGDEKSLKTGEFIGREIFAKIQDYLPERYLKILAKINRCETENLLENLNYYCGSPYIIRDYLRRDDRAIFAELNRQEFVQLKKVFAGSEQFSIINEDGFSLLKSKLPPLQKRALVLIDPAFEKDQSVISADYEKIILSLKEGYKRFENGVYLVWHPIIKNDESLLENFYKEISALKFEKKTHVIFDVGSKDDGKMHSCGMFIFNAPWQLDEKLEKIFSRILPILKQGENAFFKIKNF